MEHLVFVSSYCYSELPLAWRRDYDGLLTRNLEQLLHPSIVVRSGAMTGERTYASGFSTSLCF